MFDLAGPVKTSPSCVTSACLITPASTAGIRSPVVRLLPAEADVSTLTIPLVADRRRHDQNADGA